MVVALWPVLLTGIYAISQRKEKVSAQETAAAVDEALALAEETSGQKLTTALENLKQENELIVKREVKLALEEAAQEANKTQGEEDA